MQDTAASRDSPSPSMPLKVNTTEAVGEPRSEEPSPVSGVVNVARRNSGGGAFRTSTMTPRGGSGRFGSFIRTSYLEEKKTRSGFRWQLKFEDPDVEQLYMEESWKKTQRGYTIFVCFLLISSAWEWIMLGEKRLPFILTFITLEAAALSPQTLILCRLQAQYGPYAVAALVFLEAFINCYSMFSMISQPMCRRLEHEGEIPPMWLLAPVLHHIAVYFAPLSFYDGFNGRATLTGIAALSILFHAQSVESMGLFISFVATNTVLLRELHKLEKHDRDYFLETHLALKSLHNMPQKEEAAQEEEMTLVRNAMHLAFPNNPFHDAATEARIEKCKQEVSVVNIEQIKTDGLVPIPSAPVPRHVLHLAGKLRGIRVARYKHHGDPVVVQSIPNLEVLESDLDLCEFIRVVDNAAGLADVPGLTKTVGYCLSPCTFVVEDVVEEPVVTLRDLALELGAEELRLDWFFFKPLISCLSGTLAVLHRNGTLHRHVSSATILLTSKETCVLPPISFHHALPEARKKLWGTPTIWRVAPEAKDTPKAYTTASEVWALCVVAWEMLVGPFSFQVTPFAFPPTVPKALVHLIIEGLSDDPDGRPTMDELFNAVNQADPSRDSTVASAEVFERVLRRLDHPKTQSSQSNSGGAMESSKLNPQTTAVNSKSSSVPESDVESETLPTMGSKDTSPPNETPLPAIKPATLHPAGHQSTTSSPMKPGHRVKFAAFEDDAAPT